MVQGQHSIKTVGLRKQEKNKEKESAKTVKRCAKAINYNKWRARQQPFMAITALRKVIVYSNEGTTPVKVNALSHFKDDLSPLIRGS